MMGVRFDAEGVSGIKKRFLMLVVNGELNLSFTVVSVVRIGVGFMLGCSKSATQQR
jgi:hypothetical protein